MVALASDSCYSHTMPRYTLPLDDDTYEWVKREADRDDRSIAAMLRRLIVEALEARNKENA